MNLIFMNPQITYFWLISAEDSWQDKIKTDKVQFLKKNFILIFTVSIRTIRHLHLDIETRMTIKIVFD